MNYTYFYFLIGTIVINPCNPVEAQKADPYTPSLIVKPASEYSKYCKAVNITANIIVKITPSIAAFLFPAIKAWCPKVIKANSPTI